MGQKSSKEEAGLASQNSQEIAIQERNPSNGSLKFKNNPSQNVIVSSEGKNNTFKHNYNSDSDPVIPNENNVSRGIYFQGDITADHVVVANIAGNANTVTLNQTITPTPPPDRIEFNVQDPIESFTGREEFIQKFHFEIEKNKLKGVPTVLSQTNVISGMGGVGKTETVRKYIQMYKKFYNHALWINAESYSEARQCFLKLAAIARITIRDLEGKPKDDQSLTEEIYNVVCAKPSLIIFDNAQSMENDDGIKPWLPKSIQIGWQIPAIIVTTRDRTWKHIVIIELGGFTNSECYSLLISQLQFPDTDENRRLASEISELCEGLPLVIQQVIAVIQDEAEISEALFKDPYGMKEFILEVEESKSDYIKAKPADSAVGDSVFTIFEMTFKRLTTRDHGKLAVRCLEVMSMLNPDNIPSELLEKLIIIEQKRELAQAMNLLHRFNLNTRCQGYYKIHRMIQAVTLNSQVISNPEERISLTDKTIERFQDVLSSLPTNGGNFHVILDNAIRLSKNGKKINEYIRFDKTLASKLHSAGRYKNAIELYDYILKIQRSKIGSDHFKTLKTQSKLATAHKHQGDYKMAEELYKRVLVIRKETLGPTHLDTMSTETGLAEVYQKSGAYEESEKLYLNALHTMEKVLGPTHPQTMIIKNDLSIIYNNLDRYNEAKELNLDALNYLEANFGPNDPNTLTTKHNLIRIYLNLREYKKAEEIAKDVLERRTHVLGPTHPFTMTTKGQLTSVYLSQQKYEMAEDLLEEMLEIQNKFLGPTHPNTLSTRSSLAFGYLFQGKYNQAEELYKNIIAIQENTLGSSHPTTSAAENNLGIVYLTQGKYNQAEKLYKNSNEIKENTLGSTHPSTLLVKNNLGVVYLNQGKYAQADLLFQELIKTQEKVLGKTNSLTLKSKNHLGTVYFKRGLYNHAGAILKEVLQIRLNLLGQAHPDTLTTRNSLAGVYVFQGKYTAAESLYQEIIQSREQILGANHKDTITSKKDLALLYLHQEHPDKAEELLLQVLPIYNKTLGPNHPETLTARHILAEVYQHQGKLQESSDLYNLVLELRKSSLGATHPDTIATETHLATLNEKLQPHRPLEV